MILNFTSLYLTYSGRILDIRKFCNQNGGKRLLRGVVTIYQTRGPQISKNRTSNIKYKI